MFFQVVECHQSLGLQVLATSRNVLLVMALAHRVVLTLLAACRRVGGSTRVGRRKLNGPDLPHKKREHVGRRGSDFAVDGTFAEAFFFLT